MNNDDILNFNPELAAEIGLNEAIIFNQLLYWNKYGDGWVTKSYYELQEQFPFLSTVTIRRVLQSLIDREIIECRRSQSCNAYRVVFISQPSTKMIDQDDYLRMIKMNNCYGNKNLHNITSSLSSYSSLTFGKIKKKVRQEQEEQRTAIATVKKLIAIWQEHIPSYKGTRLKLAKSFRNKKLFNVFTKHFKSDIKEWQRFVLYITKSKFLMGGITSFQVSLDWVMIEQNLLKICRGCYHSEEERREYRGFKKLMKSLEDLKNNINLDSRWKNTLQKSIEEIGKDVFVSWFADLKFISIQDGVLTLKALSNFRRDYIDQQYGKKLLRIAVKYFEGLRKINLISGEIKRVKKIKANCDSKESVT